MKTKHLTDEEIAKQSKALSNERYRRDKAIRHAENLPLLGKCFKYRNSYGSGSKGWWLYKKVISVNGNELKAFQFESMADGRLQCCSDFSYGVEGYTEIPRAEYDKAWEKFLQGIADAKIKAEKP